tara:strand:- start:234 stop:437 length:204 start_codon:yes stop_codon:yes gene_type:complete
MSHPDLEYLEHILSTHNWRYMCANDGEVWRKGTDQATEIRRQMDICCGLGLSKEANDLYEHYFRNHS